MSSVQSSGDPRGGGARIPYAQLVQTLADGMVAQLLPLLVDIIKAELDDLRRRMGGESPPRDGPDDIANLNIIAGQITAYERRWRDRFGQALQRWPDPPAAAALDDAFGLVSDEELQAQLIGQPVIEALERRHGDILDTIEKRLWSLAAALGGQVRPDNPFSPRHVVESFLHTFTAADCGPRLRDALLRHCERLAGARLDEAYAWCNRQLADAGLALASVSDYATLAATTVGARGVADVAKLDVWGADNALAPAEASWRVACGAERDPRRDVLRGDVLRHAARTRREGSAVRGEGVRDLREEEFLAVLSLLQGESAPLQDVHRGYARALRAGLSRVAGSLGIDSASAVPSAGQEDALELVGDLFDQLAGQYLLSAEAHERMARLALPCLRLALADPGLFDQPQPVAMRVLSRLVELWDGNSRASPVDAELHDLADAVASEVAEEEFHGDEAVFSRALQRLERTLGPLRRRASISERRTWQAIEGRERLDAARRAADRELVARLQGQPLLPAVATFLAGQWRQSLAQAWLRAGPDSDRYTAAVALGDELVRLDMDASGGRDARVADRLISLQPRLHACYLACGIDEQDAVSLIAGLVAAFANPDAPRGQHGFTPLSKASGGDEAGQAPAGDDGLEAGRILVQVKEGEPVRALRLAWRSRLSGTSLLVNAQGTRELLLSPRELAAMLAQGGLLPRPPVGPVEAALQRLEAALAAPAPD